MNRTRSAGFVITLEFLLVMALFVVPLIIGMIMVGRKLFTLYLNKRDFIEQPYSRAVVWDSSATPKAIGPVLGYDQFEAPLVLFRDDATKAGASLGVRSNRFTSYGEVFYDGLNCTGTPYLRVSTVAVGTGPGYITNPPIGFSYQLQGVSYAMGKPNVLYSSTDTSGVNDATLGIQSVWKSQDWTNPAATSAAGNVPPCFDTVPGMIDDLAPATQVIDFDSAYTAPYRSLFPTPVAGPALPCPTAECGP